MDSNNCNLIPHDGARPHDEEGNGHTGCDDKRVAKSVQISTGAVFIEKCPFPSNSE